MNQQIIESQNYFIARCVRNNREIKKRCYIWFDESSDITQIRIDYFINRTHIGSLAEYCNEPSSIYWLNWKISNAIQYGYECLYKRM
jgi:hypothetical protein